MSEAQRRALGGFLRSRRERLSPESVGLPPGLRRRARGLRREEVALLSGVSVSWYTWLEQGRDINVSRQVLDALARTLRLVGPERRHLYLLADELPPPQDTPSGEGLDHLLAVLGALEPHPACLRDRHWDLIGWNRAEAALFTDFAELPARLRNMIWVMFGWPPVRTLLVDWAAHAQHLVAQFRASADRHPDDPRFAEIIADLHETGPAFSQFWERHDIAGFEVVHREFRHERVGTMRLRTTKLLAAEDTELQIITRVPTDEDSAGRLWLLTAAD
ncbi:helix-turn-helix domain-containing protein [Solihabitans fulvus]|uniref:Helix-turn-helix domain-containing protein n=1 Tax=Solihabitans fulvus TaxID=1892852 RepID=A0A5B2XG23_9PSEU|nr:helix-turn-helix transcriptional regulator [Solihabitans fulvus]KAA2261985.1 helix-turn-helix domain-containing protein [Solihabitans fulvus]